MTSPHVDRFYARFGVRATLLAVKMGRRPDYVSTLLRNRGTSTITKLVDVQQALGCEMAELLPLVVGDDWKDGRTDRAVI